MHPVGVRRERDMDTCLYSSHMFQTHTTALLANLLCLVSCVALLRCCVVCLCPSILVPEGTCRNHVGAFVGLKLIGMKLKQLQSLLQDVTDFNLSLIHI